MVKFEYFYNYCSNDFDYFSHCNKYCNIFYIHLCAAFVFLFGSLALRKRQTKTEILLEETAIRSAGIQKPHIPRIILAVIVFILCLVLFRRKILTWFFLIAANLAAMGYWFHLARKGRKNSSSSAFHAYNDGSMT